MLDWQTLGRRALMRGSLRYLVLGGLSALGAALLYKRYVTAPDCTNQGLCQRCRGVEDCHLPLAVQYKNKR